MQVIRLQPCVFQVWQRSHFPTPAACRKLNGEMFRFLKRRSLFALSLMSFLAIAGCNTDNLLDVGENSGSTPTGFGANDLTARTGTPTRGGTLYSTRNRQSGGELYMGADPQVRNSPTGSEIYAADDGYQLNFESADVSAVAKAILGDVLQATYTIDARVSGTISMSSANSVAKSSLVPILETALKSVNASIVHEGNLYRIIPSSDRAGAGRIEVNKASDGYGVTAIPVKNVAVGTVAKLMENFVTTAGAIRPDPAMGMILVVGTAQERRAALEAASVLDTDVMRSQSVGIFPLANSAPETVISEMQRISSSGEGGLSQGQVQFQPMERMNAVLVIARSKETLNSAARWIQRLDRLDPEAVGVKVYRLRYMPAAKVAAMLNDIFSAGTAGAGTTDQDALKPNVTSFVDTASADQDSEASGKNGSVATSSSENSWTGAAGIDTQGIEQSTSGAASGGSDSGVRVTADVTNNALLIYASKTQYRSVEAVIRQIDRAPEQVAIEATIAEVTLSNQLQYGVQAYLQSSDFGLASDKGAGGFTTSVATPLISAVVPGANLILGSTVTPRVILNALHALTNVKILSSPSLVVLDNQTATLQVGNQVAIKSQSSQSTDSATAPVINNITYKDTGIILNVSPRIGANGIVTLEIQQEISNVVDNSGGTDGLTPTISQRRVKSSIAVPSGQTVMLAGLISNKTSKGRSGLPGSNKWGFLGDLLATNNDRAERNELVIFIKPQIIRDQFDAQAAAEEFRSRLGALNAAYSPSRR
jgi:general secretion pathway protein D